MLTKCKSFIASKSWLRRLHQALPAIMKEKIGTIVKEESFFNEVPETKSSEFVGDLYLLIDRSSYSAASSFHELES